MSKSIIIAAAQFSPVKGDVTQNIKLHESLIEVAHSKGVDVIFFPELSLTGYEPELAKSLSFQQVDDRLTIFQTLSDKYHMAIIVGAPLKMKKVNPQIASFIIRPHKSISHYSKKFLHPGEDRYFSPGEKILVMEFKGSFIGISICADNGYEQHFVDLKKAGASVILSPMLISANGYENDISHLVNFTRKNRLAVVMANFIGESGGYQTVGKSAAWDSNGNLLAKADSTHFSLVMINFSENIYETMII